MTNDDFIHAVKRNNQRLFLIALSFTQSKTDSEDIIQNVFLKLWRCSKPFKDDIHMDKWLTTVCVNESKNYIKSLFRRYSETIDNECEGYSFDNSQEYDLFSAVMSLPKKERTVIHLFYYEDLSVKDISEILKIRGSSVKTRLHRARNKLKEILGDEWIYEQN